MSSFMVSVTSLKEQHSCSLGGLGARPQQAKKGPARTP
jgi:hypothetical protein